MGDEKDLINLIPLEKEDNDLAQQIIEEKDALKVKNLTYMFNLNQAKKNVIRIMKLNNLLDKVQDQMVERFDKKPGEFSNSDLLEYMQVSQSAIDRATKSLNLVDDTPAITMNQINVNVTDDPILNKESRDNVTTAIKEIMKKLNLSKEENSDVIEIESKQDNKIDDNPLKEEEE